MMTAANEVDNLTIKQTAQRLGVHPDDVRRWIRRDECPTVREGRRVRIPAAWADDPKGWLVAMLGPEFTQ